VTSREEERISFRILSLHFGQVFVGGVFCPSTCREDVLVPLIPSSVYDFGSRRVIVESFKLVFGYCRLFVLVLARLVERVIDGRLTVSLWTCGNRRCFGWLRGVIEEGAVEACHLVEQEVVDLVML
jgi:hypothetical protein